MAETLTRTEESLRDDTPEGGMKLSRDLYDQCALYYREDHEEIDRAMRYVLDHKHWQGLSDQKDPFDLWPQMPDLFHLNRQIAARIGAADIYLGAIPVDKLSDPETASYLKRVMEYEMETKRFNVVKRDVVASAVHGGVGIAKLCAVAGFGAFGSEIYPETVDPTKFYMAPGFRDIHHPLCPYVLEVVPMQIEEIRRLGKLSNARGGWNVPDDLTPDVRAGEIRANHTTTDGPASRQTGNDIVWVSFLWHKRDITAKQVARVVELPPPAQYMICPGCKWQSPPQAGLPPEAPGPCPQCGSEDPLRRVDREVLDVAELTYPRGRIVIAAINQRWREPFYDGKWPERDMGNDRIRGLRSFPYWYYTQHTDPRRAVPKSNTHLHSDEQNMIDMLTTLGYWQAVRNRDWIVGKPGSLENAQGLPFEQTLDPREWFMGIKDVTSAAMLRQFQGSGMSAGLEQMIGLVKRSLAESEGTFTLPQQGLKGIAVGTAKAAERTGDAPVDEAVDILRDSLGPYVGVWADWWSIVTTEAKATRFSREDGRREWLYIEGADIPQMDVILTAQPRLELKNVEQSQEMLRILSIPDPIMRRLAWEGVGLPKERLAEFEDEQQKMQEKQGMPGQPPGAPPMQNRLAGMMPAGANGGVQNGG